MRDENKASVATGSFIAGLSDLRRNGTGMKPMAGTRAGLVAGRPLRPRSRGGWSAESGA
jgi:hypothetical protein